MTYAKMRILGEMDLELYPWTYIFFHPVKDDLLNYLMVCLIFGIWGLIRYLWKEGIRREHFLKVAEQTQRL
jgi:hypothetical protein